MTAAWDQALSVGALPARVGRALLTAVAAVLYVLGWSVAMILGSLWLVVTWSAAAVQVGWREARTTRRRGEP